jgi:predicted metal-dependent enzyme (double-stranded beta helix superfamily)
VTAIAPFVHPDLARTVRRGVSLADAIGPRGDTWTADRLATLSALLTGAAASGLRGIARHDPARRWWTRLVLTDEIEVWLIGWTPGQGTRPHNHGGASGAFTVVEGELAETYRDGPTLPIRAEHRAGASAAFGPERVHIVRNDGESNATSVHAYSPPLLPLQTRPLELVD